MPTPRVVLYVVVAAVAVAVVASLDLPPTEEQLGDAFRSIGEWTLALAGALAFVEVGTPVGLVAPTEFAVPLAGAASAAGAVGLVPLVGAVWVCAAIGESLSFLAGRHLGRDYVERHHRALRVTPERLERFDRHFARYGRATVILARFGPYIRTLTPFLAGGSRMPYRRFLGASIIGTGLWSASLCGAGYLFFEHITAVRDVVLGVGVGVLATAIALALISWARSTRRRRPAVPSPRERAGDQPVEETIGSHPGQRRAELGIAADEVAGPRPASGQRLADHLGHR
jgi:membrane-associated protein